MLVGDTRTGILMQGVIRVSYTIPGREVSHSLIAFIANILPQALRFPNLDTVYLLNDRDSVAIARNVTVTNSLEQPLRILSVVIPDGFYGVAAGVPSWNEPFTLAPGRSALLPILLYPNASYSNPSTTPQNSFRDGFLTYVGLKTNSSDTLITFPVVGFTGALVATVSDSGLGSYGVCLFIFNFFSMVCVYVCGYVSQLHEPPFFVVL